MQNHKIAEALENVKAIADKKGANIIQSAEVTRKDRTLLVRTKWLQEITKGWYLLTRPDLALGDSAAWHANFWDFLRIYCNKRYKNNYCLSAEISLSLQIGTTLIPKQVIIIVPTGGTVLHLPFKTSILTYADSKNIPKEKIEFQGLQVMPLAYALCKITPTFFRRDSADIEIALRTIRSSADLSRLIIKHHFLRAAERIIGAYQFFDMLDQAKAIQDDLETAGEKIIPVNPFSEESPKYFIGRVSSPYAARIKVMWNKYRNIIVDKFQAEPGLPKNTKSYLDKVNEMYSYDAYNSLSIEGYHVTKELIEKVRRNNWNPELNSTDATEKNALAARGYFECFQAVKDTLTKILKKKNPGKCVAEDLSTWYQQLFAPCVRANIISVADLIGYRNDRVYIRNSRHAPPPKEAVLDSMEAFFECLQEEPNAAVRAILGHYIFVYIHPYMDGNGRIARFIMNAMFASGGYPWTVVELERRKEYIHGLEHAHTEMDINLFVKFILEEMKRSKKLWGK